MKIFIYKLYWIVFLNLCLYSCSPNESSNQELLTIQGIDKKEGFVGSKVRIQGTGFSTIASQNEVRFNGVLSEVISASSTIIETIVPAAASGKISVTVNNEEALGPNFTIILTSIAFTSFEEVPTFIGDIYYKKKAMVDLQNTQIDDPTSTDPYVDFTATGKEIGFDLSFDPDDIGDAGNERIGVFSNENIATEADDFETQFQDGHQGFLMSDPDGTLVLTLDPLKNLNSAMSIVTLTIKLYIAQTEFEEGEGIQVFYKTDDGLGNPLIDFIGAKANTISGSWQTISVMFPKSKNKPGQLLIKLKSSTNDEMIFIDSLSIQGN